MIMMWCKRYRSGVAILVLAFSCLFFSEAVLAAKYYKWTDNAGRSHFTDDLAKVPVEYRITGERDLRAVPSKGNASSNQLINGKDIWQSKCSQCHHLSFEDKVDSRGLAYLVIDAETRYPRDIGKFIPNLRSAIDGDTSIMDAIELSEDELKALARYMRASAN